MKISKPQIQCQQCYNVSKTDVLTKSEYHLKCINRQGSELCSQKHIKEKTKLQHV